ncbi:MAG: guanylate cyclase [Leptospirales bacterium]|nr:guanylate cyclase [Leptospirales bacterium]
MSRICFLCLLIAFSGSCVRERESFVPPRIADGRADLREWDFGKRGPLQLSGDWEFHWNELDAPVGLEGSLKGARTVPVPAHWTSYTLEEKPLPIDGKATFRLVVELPRGSRDLALRLPSADTVFVLYVNGTERTRNGNILEGSERTKPIYYAPIVLPLESSDKLEIVMHFANSIYPRPGFRDPLEIGTRQDLEGAQNRKIWFDIFLFGSLFVMALYHFGLFALRPQDRSPLYFAVFCLAMGVRLFVTGEAFAFRILPITWQVSTFLEYLTFYLAGPAILLFLSSLFPEERLIWIDRSIVIVTALFSAVVIFAPLPIYTQTLVAYQILVLIFAVYAVYLVAVATIRKRETARTFLVGASILLLSVVNDIAYAMRLIQSTFLVPLGVFVFFFSQAFLLSRRFATAFNTAEVLSKKMEEKVVERTAELVEARDRSDGLLRNILPAAVAEELKETGRVKPTYLPSVTVLFTDFEGFTSAAEKMPPDALVTELDRCFRYFDGLMDKYGLEKLKTIGDSYMCAGGLPRQNMTHALDATLCALDMLAFMQSLASRFQSQTSWNIRIGLHTGPVVAGVIGEKKFVYDIWGDTVNVASRMEEAGQIARLNVSETTYALIREYVEAEERGLIQVKGKSDIRMFFINGLKPEFAASLKA